MSLNQLIRQANKAWHGVKLGQPDWGDHSHSLAFEAELRQEGLRVYLILNAYWEPLDFELPPVGDGGAGPWRRWIDTALESPAGHRPVAGGARVARPIGRRRTPSWCCSARSGVGKFLGDSEPLPPLHFLPLSVPATCWTMHVRSQACRLAAQLGLEVSGSKYFRAACAGGRAGGTRLVPSHASSVHHIAAQATARPRNLGLDVLEPLPKPRRTFAPPSSAVRPTTSGLNQRKFDGDSPFGSRRATKTTWR